MNELRPFDGGFCRQVESDIGLLEDEILGLLLRAGFLDDSVNNSLDGMEGATACVFLRAVDGIPHFTIALSFNGGLDRLGPNPVLFRVGLDQALAEVGASQARGDETELPFHSLADIGMGFHFVKRHLAGVRDSSTQCHPNYVAPY